MSHKRYRVLSTILLLALVTGCEHKMEQRKKDAALAGKPYSPLVRIADSMNNSQDYPTAIKLYRQAVNMDPKDLDAQLGLAKALAAVGQFNKAVETLEIILAKQEHTEALLEMGKIHLANNRPEKCIKTYSRVINKDGQNVRAMNGLGVCYDIKGKHERARKWYERALALAPNHSGVKSNKGLSLMLEGKYEEALPVLSELADRSNASPRDRQNLAVAFGLSGDPEKAAQLFSIDLGEEDVRRNLAVFHLQEKAISTSKTLALQEAQKENSDTSAIIDDSAAVEQSDLAQVSPVY